VKATKTVRWHTYSDGEPTVRNTRAAVYTPALDTAGTAVDAYGWAPTQTSEPNEDRVASDYDLFLPTVTGGPRDVVDIPAVGRFEVVGNPQDWGSGPFGSRFGAVVKLKRTER
jgi:hypothetical protein